MVTTPLHLRLQVIDILNIVTTLEINQVVAQTTLVVAVGNLPHHLIIENSGSNLQNFSRVPGRCDHRTDLLFTDS